MTDPLTDALVARWRDMTPEQRGRTDAVLAAALTALDAVSRIHFTH